MSNEQWPKLATPGWRETADTLQLWTQIVGKTRLVLLPPINHAWNSTLYPSARGLTTGPMPFKDTEFEVEFDFVDHRLWIRQSDGQARSIRLEAQSVAQFYRAYLEKLESLGIQPHIYPVPNELPAAIPFARDESHCSYDPSWANAFWRALLRAQRVMTEFRARFIGKVSPVHFFWGAFDLAVTRFSGRPAPLHPGGFPNIPDYVIQEAYSHEVSSAGFWPGNDAYPEAAFYSYAYPEPPGYGQAKVRPEAAFYHPTLREFLLPYEAVRRASEPSLHVLEFFEDTYRAAAERADWDRLALERPSLEKNGRADQSCVHLEEAARGTPRTTPNTHGCQECLAMGRDWVALRLCLTCGHVGCSDSSAYQHATHHFHATGHPLIRAYEPGEEWGYCYLDQAFLQISPSKHDPHHLETPNLEDGSSHQ